MDLSVDWAVLREASLAAAHQAYAPYSGFAVGCAALVDDGRVISGCNVENASYGVTLCAECAMIGQLHLGGGGKLVAFDCVGVPRKEGDAETGADTERSADPAAHTITPCGRCRQLLFEAAAPGLLLNTPDGVRTIEDLLPQAFGPAAMA
ncbi:cytidine deaminase [Leucobacter viscericola]|uniref:Cytidine deaminase n=1 Tax=Leucobacter viscericola TaxID=2714935 RepID=A0A6G7XG76_9MICO|nr:cytidine deaminase [Leucobacter viscericola]QIK63553.1 cytidine deaminase [Leucobacter viscericola]